MTILFLLSTVVSSITHYIDLPSHSCQTLTDIYNTAKYYYRKHQFIESYRIFFELEMTNYRQSVCAWYQIQCLLQLGHWRHAIYKCHEWKEKQPQVAQWYLIASEIYMNRFDFTLAWEELLQASVHVPNTDDSFDEICFKKRISYEGRRVIQSDILDDLPYDVACDVFQCLDLESLVRCTRVSKKWRHCLLSSSHLWNDLQFSKRAAQLKISTLDTYLSRIKRTGLTKLSIQHQQTDGDGIFMTLAQRDCCRLKTLILSDIICTPALFFNALEYIGSTLNSLQWGGVSIRLNDIIDNIPTICKDLKHLVVHDCFTSLQNAQLQYRLDNFGDSFPTSFIEQLQTLPKLNQLQSLELSGIHGLTASHLASILIRCPNIRKLSLKRCLVNIIPILNMLRFCPKLQYFEYERNRYCQQFDMYQPPQIKRKNLVEKKEYPWIELKIRLTNTQDILLFDDPSRVSLETLDFQGTTFLPLSKPMKNLKSICLKDCFHLTSKDIQQLIHTSPLLREIDLSCLAVIDNDLLHALTECKHLHYLNLSYCKLDLISNQAFTCFIDKTSHTLKRLVLDYTTHFSMDLHLYAIKKIKRGVI